MMSAVEWTWTLKGKHERSMSHIATLKEVIAIILRSEMKTYVFNKVFINDYIPVNKKLTASYRMNSDGVRAGDRVGTRSIVPSPICPLRNIDEDYVTTLPEDKRVPTQHRVPSMTLQAGLWVIDDNGSNRRNGGHFILARRERVLVYSDTG